MPNNLEKAKIFQTTLDQLAVQTALTGWMEANAGQVKYNGGDEVKIPTLTTQGLANYSRTDGYTTGDVTLTYKSYTMTQDRGRKFELDAIDVDETNFIATASAVMAEFQTAHVTPEIDAYRLSALVAISTKTENKATNAKFGYTPNRQTILEEIKKGIKAIRDAGYQGELVCHLNSDTQLELEMAMAGKLTNTTFSVGGIDTTVPSVDNVPLIVTPQNRLVTQIEIVANGTGGFNKATNAKDVNFIIAARNVPIAISKQDTFRIFDPQTNQAKNAWALDYRKFHDVWVLANKEKFIYANIKDAE